LLERCRPWYISAIISFRS